MRERERERLAAPNASSSAACLAVSGAHAASGSFRGVVYVLVVVIFVPSTHLAACIWKSASL